MHQKSARNRCLLRLLVLGCCLSIACQTKEKSDAGLLEVNGTELYYRVIGEGEPILVLHGGPGLDHTYFLPQLENLSENYRLIFFDQRVSGRSSLDVDSAAVSLDNFLHDIDEVRQAFGVDKINLMGHSWGGLLAMYYAKTYPENLKSLILVNPTPASSVLAMQAQGTISQRITQQDQAERQALMQSDSFRNGNETAYEELYRLMFKPSFKDTALLDDLTLKFQPGFGRTMAMLRLLYKDFAGYDIHADLQMITCPTLIVQGDYDPTPLEAIQKIDENIPDSQLVVLKDCGHFPFIEKPEEFLYAISTFLNGKQ